MQKLFEDQKNCPICKSQTMVFSQKNASLKDYTTWYNESTMRLLNIDAQNCQLRLCHKCLHFFRYPLYEEAYLYNEKGPKVRKEAFEKYNPTEIYGFQESYFDQALVENIANSFMFLWQILSGFKKQRFDFSKKSEIKILDWGGGSGYVCETISLMAQKLYSVPTQAYCFDYQDFAADTRSPYYKNIATNQIDQLKPYDIIIFSHVLEHVNDPNSFLQRAKSLLSSGGVLLVVLPYEAYTSLSPKCAYMNFHQHLFTLTSVRQLLIRNGFVQNHISLKSSNYREHKNWSIFCIAQLSTNKKVSSGISLKVQDIYYYSKLALGMILKKLWKR